MFKKLLSLLSLSVLAAMPMAVVSCSNDKLSYNLTENDMSLITNISENFNDFSIKKGTLLKNVFTSLDETKEIIFEKFKEETKDNYVEKEFDKKKQQFNKLEISIVYFNKEHDVVNDGHHWSIAHQEFNKNSNYFQQFPGSSKLEMTLEEFSIDMVSDRWKNENYDQISKYMTIILGNIIIDSEPGNAPNAWVEGIKVNTKFE
jgi:hypothetical protein